MGATQKSIFITGTSTGIGQAAALALAKKGWLVFAGVRKPADITTWQQENIANITPVMIDVTDEKSICQAYETVVNTVGKNGLHGLINNAGMVTGGPLEFLPVSELRQQLEVNVLGQIAVTQAFMEILRIARGRIINISSVAGRSTLPFVGPYSASKHAIEALSDALRMELHPWGIEVVLIEPGSIATPIWDKSISAAEKRAESFPKRATELYGDAMEKIRNASHRSGDRGISPDYVVKAIIHALEAGKPKTRYIVGKDAKMRIRLNCLPDRLKDWLICSKIGLS